MEEKLGPIASEEEKQTWCRRSWEGWSSLHLCSEFSTLIWVPPENGTLRLSSKQHGYTDSKAEVWPSQSVHASASLNRDPHTVLRTQSLLEKAQAGPALQRCQLQPSQSSWVHLTMNYCFSKWQVSYIPWPFHPGTLPGCQKTKTMQKGYRTSPPETRHKFHFINQHQTKKATSWKRPAAPIKHFLNSPHSG